MTTDTCKCCLHVATHDLVHVETLDVVDGHVVDEEVELSVSCVDYLKSDSITYSRRNQL